MSFKDTFTKDEAGKEDTLVYDDTAFFYFLSSVLVIAVVPWTISLVNSLIWPEAAVSNESFPAKSKNGSGIRYCESSEMMEKMKKARKSSTSNDSGAKCLWIVKLIMLAVLWMALLATSYHLSNTTEIKRYDPFDILECDPGSNAAEIKKAYRKLSLIYHPDKNPNDPLAASRFIQLTKAYNALTDETAKANYEKYGNPEGPQTEKFGIGLPRFLLEKDNHLAILCFFFFILLFVVPMVFICYYQRTKNYAANGVIIETVHFLAQHPLGINEATRLKNCPELLAASAESRSMTTRSTDNEDMKMLTDKIIVHSKPKLSLGPSSQFSFTKNFYLILVHMQRLHHLMSPNLKEDLDELLSHSLKISFAMIEIACHREWFNTATAMIEFRRSLVQALDVKSSQLLQISHFNEEILKHCQKGKNATSSLVQYTQMESSQRKGLSEMSAQQLEDVEAFCKHCSRVDLDVKIEVEDEADCVQGDFATVTATLTRKNLAEGEAAGPVHAPLFPEPKFEEWWVFLVEDTPNPSPRIIQFERIRDIERVVTAKMLFQATRPGKMSFKIYAFSDSYRGIDEEAKVTIDVKTPDQVKREVFVHAEDLALDDQPTLFQQFMGELGGDEESEEEDEDDKKEKKIEKLSDGKKADAKDDDDEDSDDSEDSDDDGDD